MSHQITSDATIQAALAGEERAWEQVIATFTPKLTAIVSRRATADVEDVVQETYVRAWASRSTFNRLPSPDNFGAWLGSIAFHLVIDQLRSGHHRLCQPWPVELELLLADPEPLPEELALLHEQQQAVQELLDGLSSAQAEALRLFLFQGRSYEEIACQLGVESGVVKGRIRAARDSLRRHFTQGKLPELLLPASDHGVA